MDTILIIILGLLLIATLAILYLNIKSKTKKEDENKEAEEIANLNAEIVKLKYSLNATRIKEIGSLTQMKISSEDMSKFSQLHTCLDVGDAILFSYRLAHKSGNNLSNIPRTTIIARYTDFKGKWDSGWN